jgi:hypothetical protein
MKKHIALFLLSAGIVLIVSPVFAKPANLHVKGQLAKCHSAPSSDYAEPRTQLQSSNYNGLVRLARQYPRFCYLVYVGGYDKTYITIERGRIRWAKSYEIESMMD